MSAELLALFVGCLGSGFFVPVPEDIPLLLAGWQVRIGSLPLGPTLLVSVAGVLGRDSLAYGIGKVGGPRLAARPFIRRLFGDHRIARGQRLFAERGWKMVFLSRFAVGMRLPLYFVAGTLGQPLRGFLLADLAGLAVTVPATLGVGYALGPGAAETFSEAVVRQRWIVGGFAIGLLLMLWRQMRVDRRREEG